MARADRIRLLRTSDPHITLQPGSVGTVVYPDTMGTTHIDFDDGTRLGLIADEDSFELVDQDSPSKSEADQGERL